MASVVGYDEAMMYYEPDPYNKIPKYCSRCGKSLASYETQHFDPYTGNPVDLKFLRCPTLNGLHDIWKREAYGAWVNHGNY